MEKPRVVVTGTLPAAGLDLLRERYAVETADPEPREELLAQLPGGQRDHGPHRRGGA
jgi:hypothetical protein